MSAEIVDLQDEKLKRQLKLSLHKIFQRKPCKHGKRELYTPWGWMCVKCLDERRPVR